MNTRTYDDEFAGSPLDDIRLYDGVRTRRIFAFVADYLLVAFLCIPFAVLVFFVGIVTFGFGFALYGILFPLVALTYVAVTMGGAAQATLGMRMMSLRLARLDGAPVDPLIAVVHTVLFWAANVILTPFILLATLILDRKRTVHDLVLGTVVVRSDR